jgi:hypothetical protein
MPVTIFPSTIPGGVTPICNVCMVALCFDLSQPDYEYNKTYWDNWECQDCNPDYRRNHMRRKR